MVSAVLGNLNEPCWGEPKVYVRRYPNTTTTVSAAATAAALNYSKNNLSSHNYSHPRFKAKPNPNPNKQTRVHDPTKNVHSKGTPLPVLPGGSASSKRNLEVKLASRSGHVTINIGAYTRRELKDMKKELISDLERVQILRARIENSNFEDKPVNPKTHSQSLPNGGPKSQNRAPGSKRSNPFSNPKVKRTTVDPSAHNVMRRCGQILTKLMKDKQGWVFNTPVDVVSLRLHDYFDIIKKPMDLGTVKSNLKNNVYKSWQDFADDVRLTFNNALRYNPKGHYVYLMAETLLAKFEQMFEKLSQQQLGILVKIEKEPIYNQVAVEEEVDIGEEIPVENYPPVVIEKDDASASANANSSGSSSTTTSSDSSSISGSGSSSDDDDTAQSPVVEPKDASPP